MNEDDTNCYLYQIGLMMLSLRLKEVTLLEAIPDNNPNTYFVATMEKLEKAEKHFVFIIHQKAGGANVSIEVIYILMEMK